MSTAANHRRRSHRSQRLHYQASNRRYIKSLGRKFEKSSFLDKLIGGILGRLTTGFPFRRANDK